MLEVFTISKLYRILISKKIQINFRTLSDYLNELYIDGFLYLQLIPTRFGKPAFVYYLPTTDQLKIQKMISYLEDVNYNPKKVGVESDEDFKERQKNKWRLQKESAKELQEEETLEAVRKKSKRKAIKQAIDKQEKWNVRDELAEERNKEIKQQMDLNKKTNTQLKSKKKPLLSPGDVDTNILEEKVSEEGEVYYE